MTNYKSNARITGILFILAIVAPILGGALLAPLMEGQNYLQNLASHQPTVYFAIFMQFIMGLACAGISIALYPVLRKYREGLAMGAVGYRLLEGGLGILVAVGTSALLMISNLLATSDAQSALSLQSVAALINSLKDWIVNGPLVICWIIGAAMYYAVFYQFRLVPRWLSTWGLIGITLTFFSSILVMINPDFGTLQTITSMPILVQELVLAVWLIAKGFSPTENK